MHSGLRACARTTSSRPRRIRPHEGRGRGDLRVAGRGRRRRRRGAAIHRRRRGLAIQHGLEPVARRRRGGRPVRARDRSRAAATSPMCTTSCAGCSRPPSVVRRRRSTWAPDRRSRSAISSTRSRRSSGAADRAVTAPAGAEEPAATRAHTQRCRAVCGFVPRTDLAFARAATAGPRHVFVGRRVSAPNPALGSVPAAAKWVERSIHADERGPARERVVAGAGGDRPASRLASIGEELEAVDWYDQRAEATTDSELARCSRTTATRRRSTLR